MGAVLALAASVMWGTGDFLGGTLSRRAHPLAVMGSAQGLALVGLLAVAAATGELDAGGYLPWGVLGGLVGAVALSCFYAALAGGTMGVVAPVAATGAAVPVIVGLVAGESPTVLQLVGIVVTVAGVILASGPERGGDGAAQRANVRPLLLAGVAAAGFGTALVLVAEGSEHSIAMTLVTMRAVNATISGLLVVFVVRAAARPIRADLPTLALIGFTDAAANGLYGLATGTALVSVSAVLASLYPAVTALLAWRFHKEHLHKAQFVGVGATLAGVALLAGG
ncbi:MAG: DMT family transporter [Acidimicrobiales bacterium]